MDSGQCSRTDDHGDVVWAKLVPIDGINPEVEIHSTDAVVCSRVGSSFTKEIWCEITRSSEQDMVAKIRNLSSTGIIVNGKVVAPGAEADEIENMAEIISGPEREGYLRYTFQITLSPNPNMKNIKIELDVDDAKCSICLNVWHDVVTVAPCLHNFCNGCFSEWLRRSSNGSRDKPQNVPCPQCRAIVHSVGKNHFLQNIEKAIVNGFSSLKHSDEEIALLNCYASVKSTLVLGRKRNPRKRPFVALNDESDNSDIPCPQCGTEMDGFKCNTGMAHLQCQECGGLMPSRPTINVPQHCTGCSKVFCGAYWHAQGLDSNQYTLICQPETLKPISERTISRVPSSVHENNNVERAITERCIQHSGRTLQAVISDWIAKFDNKEMDRSTLRLDNADTITSNTHLCNSCYDKFAEFLLYWYRVSLPASLLPRDVAERENCWYGYLCRTQHHNSDHADKRNHVCRPTRGNP
ncbi:E3 ubiquitin-protein ligase CHFR [Rhynchospora pubera]|uniref:E3 ubiquitin-protein ligase CHFR n=1 Tax=Rhynchospora pubera TaxID=906938 RepID=A0AAV8C8C1_9POAL|nr:E3 ubiquitin-protein ligase CHFR [Rhynchospora pubera]